MALGLVLEGGGMRGIYTSGILDEMLLRGVKVDGLLGVSAGIIHGISYVSEQYARNIRYFVKYRSDKRFMSIASFLKSGDVCEEDFCYHQIPDELSPLDYDKFLENAEKIKVYSVATNLENGKAEYIRITDVKKQMDAVRASASLPLVSRIVEYDGMKLLDGGSSDSIPLEASEKLGFDRNIVVLTRPLGFEKKPDRTIPVMKRVYSEYPEYLKTCENRYIEYNRELEYVKEAEESGRAFVLRPSRTIKISRSEGDIEKIKRMYKLGRFDAQNNMDALIEFISRKAVNQNE
ncbi:MAG: patatin family protein [Eubacterium sp.]|nr:patatin family protein [Eubacterium sp.]